MRSKNKVALAVELSIFWLPNLGKFDSFHALLTTNGELMTQHCPCVDMQECIYFAFESFSSLKHVYWINMPRTKRTEVVKWRIIGMRDAGMKQVGIARASNVRLGLL